MKMIAVALREEKTGQAVAPGRVHAAAPCSRKAAARMRLAIEFAPREVADDLAAAHHQDAVADGEQLLELGGDEEHAAGVGGQPVDDRVDLVFGADVDAAGRLVHDEDRRLGHQPLGEHHLLLVAAGQALGRLLRARPP